MSYPKFYATADGTKTFKVINANTVTTIQAGADYYTKVGLLPGATESGITSGTVEIDESDFEDVLDDVNDCCRVGHRPVLHPH